MDEVLRQEKKYLITLDKYYYLSRQLSRVLEEDTHSSGDGYLIRSLYYDDIDNTDYEEKINGVEVRRKIRLRNYGPSSDTAKLELKQKQGQWQKKRSLILDKDKAQSLIGGNYTTLLECNSDFADECFGIMSMRCYRPKAVVTYNRKVYIAKENETRITFDHNIRGSESYFDIFSYSLVENPIFDPYIVVLEVKYNNFLLSYIKDIIQSSNESERAISKYCLGRSLLDKYYWWG
ncbi:MAG: polyphosphate polymerase domain-containing protein [Defluviitaleaceae bacterium]|nr:polyphosphate polymerase domain-containing protein [Defluviitaleaceae bacterium]